MIQRLKQAWLALLDAAIFFIPASIHPHHLTHARWIMTGPTVVLAYLGWHWSAVASLIASSACDILDGHLARRRELTTEDGAHLDAFADKFFVLVTLWVSCRHQVGLPVTITVTILEITISVIRGIKDRRKITGKSRAWGKVKTWVQSFALAFALSRNPFFALLVPWTFLAAIVCAVQSLRGHFYDIRLGKTEEST